MTDMLNVHKKPFDRNIAVVVQRYGSNITGGSEVLAKEFAEKARNELQWGVDVYTTTAEDYRTWKSVMDESTSLEHGVLVRRFKPARCRHKRIFSLFNKFYLFLVRTLFFLPLGPLASRLEHIWFILQGPHCPRMIEKLKKNLWLYDKIYFFTYLYYPTVYGVEIAGSKAIVFSTAHDEAPFYFPRVQKALDSCAAIFTISRMEHELVLGTVSDPKKVKYIGAGIDLAQVNSEGEVTEEGRPYILYMGRISRGKHVDQLIEFLPLF